MMYLKNKKWSFIEVSKLSMCFFMIGLVAGFGSILFTYMCNLGSYFFMDFIAGYRPVLPAGEMHMFAPTSTSLNKWILLFLPSIGGIFSGILVYSFAPEAEGHGTDAAIYAYHNKDGNIRARVPIIKTLASTITLTTGGSGGREGPIAQIGAGFGSFLANKLSLSNRERRIMMAVGIAAGVGSIFRAPLAGALFAAEVLYQEPDFESEVIIPAGIASVIAYCIYCLVFGWGSLFHSPPFKFQYPLELFPYLFLSIILVIFGMFYVKFFYFIIKLFKSLDNVPNYFKPALGGLITGIIGYFIQDSLAFGYGIIQKAIYNEVAISVLIVLAFGKILTTSFSIGSGGSGGVFGPSIVIGGAIGGVVGNFFYSICPSIVTNPGSFVVVGMAGFFAAVSNTPVSTIIFVSEMTNSYHLLLPSLLVCSVTYTISRKWNIFSCQVKNRVNSPAHMGDFFIDILDSLYVKDIMRKIVKVEVIPQDMTLVDFKRYFFNTTQHYFPVVNKKGKLVSIFSVNDIRSVLFEVQVEPLILVKDIGTNKVITTNYKESLRVLFKKFTIRNVDSLPVVSMDDKCSFIGMIDRSEIIRFYNSKIDKIKIKKNN